MHGFDKKVKGSMGLKLGKGFGLILSEEDNRPNIALIFAIILISGDICPNPGPAAVRHPCAVCSKHVRKNQKGISCSNCNQKTHLKCSNFPPDLYNEFHPQESEFFFRCEKCTGINLIDEEPKDDLEETIIPTDFDPLKGLKKAGRKYLHLNVNGLLSIIEEIRIILREIKPDIFAISETKLDGSVSDSEIHIDGYIPERNDRNRHGGGVCIDVREALSYTRNDDLTNSACIEIVSVALYHKNAKPRLLACIYFPKTRLQQNRPCTPN